MNLRIEAGELVVLLLRPSGCGKSTLLIVALTHAIIRDPIRHSRSNTVVPTRERRMLGQEWLPTYKCQLKASYNKKVIYILYYLCNYVFNVKRHLIAHHI